MIESYVLDITPYSLTLVEIMRKDALAKLLAGQGHPIKIRGMVNMLNYTYGLVYNYEKVNYPVTMRWGIYLNSKREATALVSYSALDSLSSTMQGRCVIPANWYYDSDTPKDTSGEVTSGIVVKHKKKLERVWIGAEREGEKLAYFPENRDPCNFGAIYYLEEGIPCFAIVIMEDGLPLMLARDQVDNWTNPEGDVRIAVSQRIRDICKAVTND